MQRRDFLIGASAALGAACLGGPAWASGINGPLKMQVGATPGGGTDIAARAMAMSMEAALKQSVVVENRPGAGGNIAASAVARAAGDPSMLLLAYTSLAINPSIQAALPFDPLRSFTPLSLIATSPLLLIAPPDLPANNVRELIDYARRNPGKLNIAGAGLGSASQLAGEMLKAQAGLQIASVPYKGAAPAVQDMLGGSIHLLLSNVVTAQPMLQAGKVKALGISTRERVDTFPDVAPIADELPGFDYRSWYGILAPAGLSAADARTLEQAAQAAARTDAVAQRLKHEGMQPVGSSGPEFAAFIAAEIERWSKVAKATGAAAG